MFKKLLENKLFSITLAILVAYVFVIVVLVIASLFHKPACANASETSSRKYIIKHESGNRLHASNGRYCGLYQMPCSWSASHGSRAVQTKRANKYVKARYGSWANAERFWRLHHWY